MQRNRENRNTVNATAAAEIMLPPPQRTFERTHFGRLANSKSEANTYARFDRAVARRVPLSDEVADRDEITARRQRAKHSRDERREQQKQLKSFRATLEAEEVAAAEAEKLRKRSSRLTPAHEILARIQHDQGLPEPETFTVGYEDRFIGIVEVPFVEFNTEAQGPQLPGGSIPSHRVVWIKQNGTVVWSKAQRINTLSDLASESVSDSDEEQ